MRLAARKNLPYLLALVLAFYVVPLAGRVIPGPVLLLLAIPAACFVISLVYGIANRFRPLQLLFPLMAGLLFLPTIVLYYNATAWPYAIVYVVISLMGNAAGYAIALLRSRL